MAGETRHGTKIPEGPGTSEKEPKNGAFDGFGQWRGVPCRADRDGQAAAVAAWLARILADLESRDGPACRSLYALRTGSARLRRQRQARRAVWTRPARRRHAGADGRARPEAGRYHRARRRRRADAAAGPPGARSYRRIILLRFRLSRDRTAHGGAGAAQQYLVPVVPSDGDGARIDRRDARKLPPLYRAFLAAMVAPQ